MSKMTEGQYRVGVNFNPSNKNLVDDVKNKSAELIDLILENGADPRSAAIAATEFESACMWAVKSITKPPR